MRKNILAILTFLFLFILSGCGSSSNKSNETGVIGETVVEMQGNDIVFQPNGTDFTLALLFTKKIDSAYHVELSDFALNVHGCTVAAIGYAPSTLILDGTFNSQEILNITGSFDQNCTTNGYIFSATQTTSKDGNTRSEPFVAEYNNPTGVYGFVNVSTPLEIGASDTDYPMTMQLLKDEYAVSGETVQLRVFGDNYGSINSTTTYTVTTNELGIATFGYVSPAVLPANGTRVTLYADLKDGNDTTIITQEIILDFNVNFASPIEYNLTNENDIIINYASESKEIAVQLAKNGVPQVGESVTVKSIPADFGRIENITVSTGADGYARFTYIAADSLTDGVQPLEFVYTDANDAEAKATATITVEAAVQPLDYNLTYETTPILVTYTDQDKEISVYVIDSQTGVGIPGKTVSISAIDGEFGTITYASTTTDAGGKAIFLYTSAHNLNSTPTSTVTVVSFTEHEVTLTRDVEIRIMPSVPVSEYSLINQSDITGTINVNDTMTTEIQLVKNGIPVIDGRSCSTVDDTVTVDCVMVASIPREYGRIVDAGSTTTRSGYVEFEYLAPSDEINITNYSFPVYYIDEEGKIAAEANITMDLNVVVDDQSGGSTEYSLINVSNITIEHGSQKEDIKAQLTYNGVPVAGKTVQMLAFSEGNGTILNSYSVETDSVGYATFFYMAPETLGDVNATTLTLTLQFNEDNIHLEVNPTVYFSETTDALEGNTSLPIVVVPNALREIVLDSNSKMIEIPIKVFKDISPYAQGSVKVELPEKVLNGVDVGLFASYKVEVNEQGIANFNYTGPSNLQALISKDDNSSLFKFYHLENSENKQEMKVLYELPSDPHITRNYELDIVTNDNFSMGIPEKEKTFTVVLKVKDSAGNNVALEDENITKITVESTNSPIAEILDTATGMLVDNLELTAANNSPFILKSKKLSGLVPVEIMVEFTDANGDTQSLTTIVNVRVFSGPASAISISYVGTEQDIGRAKYIETLAISVTDEYGNKVNTRPNITLGAIVGYAVDGLEENGKESNETKRLFYGKSDVEADYANGEVDVLGDSNVSTTNFEDNTAERVDVFQYVNAEGNNTDKLVIFGERKNYEAMGKWDIEKINNNTLSLKDDYYGVDRSQLYYAVGHNYYQDLCREDGREWLGSTDSETYKLDDEGTVTVTYKYDYHLTGKDALIWVNLDGLQPDTGEMTRVGETVKHTLRGTGLTKAPFGGYNLQGGASGYGTFIIWHENAPERYRNAHFGYAIQSGSNCRARLVATSNWFDARTCDNGQSTDGTSYLTFFLEADPIIPCTFNIDRIMPSSEF